MHTLKDCGKKLIENGYSIIPIKPNQKRPCVKGWQKLKANETTLQHWLDCGFSDFGIGILTEHTPAIDIDVHDPVVVEKIVKHCKSITGQSFQRIGQAPKTLLLFRTETPFKKMFSAEYLDTEQRKNRIEFLGQGQQFVGFGIHAKTKKPYEWPSLSPLNTTVADLPLLTDKHIQELMAYFELIVPDTWTLSSKRNDKSLAAHVTSDFENVSPKTEHTPEEIVKILSNLNAENHDRWIAIGMGLHHQFDGSKQGFELWDQWSQKAINYQPGETEKRWKSFSVQPKGRQPITFATAVFMSGEQGIITHEENEKACLARYVYIREGNRVADLNDPPSSCILSFNEFRNETQSHKFWVSNPTKLDPDRMKAVPLWEYFINHKKARKAKYVTYFPGKERLYKDERGQLCVNVFQWPDHHYTNKTDQLPILFKHFEYIFPIENEREWFLSWLAFCLQRPEERCMVTPLHVSRIHGTGRGFIARLIKALIGKWNYSRAKIEQLCHEGAAGAYHNYMFHKKICVIDEVRQKNKRFEVNDKIREILTEPDFLVNLKYGAMDTIDVFICFLLLTNHTDAVLVPFYDRRMNIFTGPDHKQSKDYFRKLYAWLNTEGLAQFFHWLMRRDLSNFNWTEPMDTPMKKIMVEQTTPPLELAFRELLEKPPSPVLTQEQIKTELTNRSEESDPFERIPSDAHLKKLLQEYLQTSHRLKVKGKNYRVWLLDQNMPKDNKQIAQHLSDYEQRTL